MNIQILRFRAPILVSIIAIALVACASNTEDRTAGWSPDKIYSEARSELDSSNYEKAVPLLEKLEARAAGSVLAQQAQLEKAYAQYRNDDAAGAVATLNRFMLLHPTSPAMDYALYLKGLVTFNDKLGYFSWFSKTDLSERDQLAAKESFESFKELVERFPDSKYTPDARQRMRYTINSLAAYEVHVARYYYSRGAYVAAINRAQLALQNYKDAPALGEALDILMNSYDALGMTQLRDDTKRIIEASFPKGNDWQNHKNKKSWWRFWE